MVNENQKVLVKWGGSNRAWFEKRGYIFTGGNKPFYARIKDLMPRCKVKIPVVCDYCGDKFYTEYWIWRDGRKNIKKDCCKKCGNLKSGEVQLIHYRDSYWPKIEMACNEKGYTLITKKESVSGIKDKVQYICPKHGQQESFIETLLRGGGCFNCKYEKHADLLRMPQDNIEEFINSHNGNTLINKEDYKKNDMRNLKIRCACGNVYITSFSAFKNDGQRCCSVCSKKASRNEQKIESFLKHNNIAYCSQKRFEGCTDKLSLPFDFYLPEYNLAIEYDGEGHYLEQFYGSRVEDPHQALLYTQRHDKIKNKYCEENGINLLRIPYWEAENIEAIISQKLEELKCAA